METLALAIKVADLASDACERHEALDVRREIEALGKGSSAAEC